MRHDHSHLQPAEQAPCTAGPEITGDDHDRQHHAEGLGRGGWRRRRGARDERHERPERHERHEHGPNHPRVTVMVDTGDDGPGGKPGRGDGRGPGGFGPGGPGRAGGGHGGHGRGPGGPHRGPGRGSRAGRGDIRGAVLLLLNEQPMHGYQLIQEITQRSGGRWSPSPGAIYPALNLLEDEGLITITADSGRKLASLTAEGVAYVESRRDTLAAPWDEAVGRSASPARALRGALEELAGAAHQISRNGSEDQAVQALLTLERARRELYLVLAGERVHPATAEEKPSSRGGAGSDEPGEPSRS